MRSIMSKVVIVGLLVFSGCVRDLRATFGQEEQDKPAPLTVNQELVAQVTHLCRSGDAPSPEGNVAWSPDGQQMAFLKGYPAKLVDKNAKGFVGNEETKGEFTLEVVVGDLWISRADGSQPRQLTRCDISRPPDTAEYALAPCWSPDGKSLAYLSGMMTGGQLVIFDVMTGQSRRLPYGAMSVRWSPDGQWLAFNGADWESFKDQRFGGLALGAIKSDGRGFRKLADGPVGQVAEWSPDGNQLLYSVYKDMEGPGDLWVAKWEGSPARQLAANVEPSGTWSPDGQWVAYAGDKTTPGLWTLNMTSGEKQRVVDQRARFPRWSNAGLFYLEDKGEEAYLCLLQARDRRKLQLTTSGNVVEVHPSPNGKQVAVVVAQKGERAAKITRDDTYILTMKDEAVQ